MTEFKFVTKKSSQYQRQYPFRNYSSFALVAGIDPLIGLYGAFVMGVVTSVFGGRPRIISGATSAIAVVMVSLVKEVRLWC